MTKGEETRQFIIERSAPIFNVKGLAATAMSDIMEATRLSKGSLYVHFENKDVLASAVVDYNMQLLGKKVQAGMAKHTSPKAKLIAYVDVLGDAIDTPVKGGCPILNFGTEADDTNTAVRKKVNETIDSAIKTITGLLKDGIKNGEFKPTLNPKEFATMMFAMIEGGVMISRVAGNNARLALINKHIKNLIEEQSE
jgi:TetR/AcrR family transcriptional regulator, transcriptional repressor for nem operon